MTVLRGAIWSSLSCGIGGGGQRGDDPVHGTIFVRGRQKPSLERAGRQIDPVVQHRVEERGVAGCRLGDSGGVVRYRGHVLGYEEDAEQVPGVLDDMRNTGRGKGGGDLSPQLL